MSDPAAFAAASITRTEPMRTAFAAVRVGIVMFTIPFVSSWYPELFLIKAPVAAPHPKWMRPLEF